MNTSPKHFKISLNISFKIMNLDNSSLELVGRMMLDVGFPLRGWREQVGEVRRQVERVRRVGQVERVGRGGGQVTGEKGEGVAAGQTTKTP